MGKGNRAPKSPRSSQVPPDLELLELLRVRSIERLATRFGVRLAADAGKDKIAARRRKPQQPPNP
jgi:hypothetical protein